jgi:hypothetical protein
MVFCIAFAVVGLMVVSYYFGKAQGLRDVLEKHGKQRES